MTSVSNIEREIKLAMEVGADLPDLRGVVGASVRQPEEVLRSVYFDTADLRLWERRVTLRHRTGEGTPSWTLKLPRPSTGGALVRSELEWEGTRDEIPEEALKAIAGIVRREPLREVVELNTERIRFALEDEGEVWAELASDVVTIVGGRRDGMRFRQLELELKGDPSDRKGQVKAVVKALLRAGASRDPQPKLEKVLGPPTRVRRPGRNSTTEDVVRWAVASGLDRLLERDCRIRLEGAEIDPEDVHQARVATRRLRSDLGTLKPLLDPIWVDHVRDDLKSAGAALGAVRDNDVLARSLIEANAGDAVMKLLAEERDSAVERLRDALTEERYLDLLDRLHAAADKPPVVDRRLASRKARRVLPGLVNRRWSKLRRDVRKNGSRPSDEQLHEVRKRSKQLRYASELSTPVIGKAARRTAKASESLQTVLGEHQDAAVAAHWLTEAGNRKGVGPVGDIAALISHEAELKHRLAGEWRSLYRRLAKKRQRAWMRNRR